ncbi:MAG: stress response translation initiation inhibitor YciH [Candidatus Pacearchaeota archaeon]
MTICPKCGLPTEACICEELSKSEQLITIVKEKRKFGKVVTIIKGFEGMKIDDLCKRLKMKLACGGRVNKNEIELQGDHTDKVKKLLIEEGFKAEQIK